MMVRSLFQTVSLPISLPSTDHRTIVISVSDPVDRDRMRVLKDMETNQSSPLPCHHHPQHHIPRFLEDQPLLSIGLWDVTDRLTL